MLPLLVLCLWGQLAAKEVSLSMARKSTTLTGYSGQVFQEDGVWNYSTMLIMEDLDLLILGARETVFALDLSNITKKKAMVQWHVTSDMQTQCSHKGKDSKIECQNYIRILHKMSDSRIYVCGTYAFSPTCNYMSFTDGKLTLESKSEDGKGKCPFDPFQRYASELVGNFLFSATSMNFLGSEPVVMRSSSNESIRTEFKTSWLNEPNFIGMEHIPEGQQNLEGDDDKVYLFFTEMAVEYDSYSKLEVSRVARVCKNDMGGQRTLQKKWTSFVKARLDCPVHDASLPFLIQHVFRFCPGNWTTCIFYGVFTPQSHTSQYSAVCTYSIADIRKVFSQGKFKTPVTVEMSFVKWVMHSGDVPFPRPGACINDEARKNGFSKSLDLPDKTLQFIRDKPLMDQAVKPISEQPLLVRRGAAFTRIAVVSVTALDGSSHQVMFIGTESGSVLKAVNYDGDPVIIEEVQLFQVSEPVKVLRLHRNTLYAGSEVAVVQMPLSSCGSYRSCLDCVLARDPYCAWDLSVERCTAISSLRPRSEAIQSLRDGNAMRCPPIEKAKAVNISFYPGNTIKLLCQPGSNLARVQWHVDQRPISSSEAYQLHSDGLLMLNASAEASGIYTCSSVESSKNQNYTTHTAVYELRLGSETGNTRFLPHSQNEKHTLVVLQVTVVLLLLLLIGLVMWNLYKGHFGCLQRRISQGQNPEGGQNSTFLEPLQASLEKNARENSREGSNSNNNHNRGVVDNTAQLNT